MTVPFTKLDKLYIGGEWVTPVGRDKETVLNPATEEVLGLAPVGGLIELDAAIGAARDAFDNGPWPRMSFKERAEVMTRMHAVLQKRLGDIQTLTIAEAAAPSGLARSLQTVVPLKHMSYAIDLAMRIEPVT